MRNHPIAVACLVFALVVCSSAAQDAASPIYKLPAEGVWAEFAWKSSELKKGTLKITSGKEVNDPSGARRWIEMALVPSEPSEPTVWRKALIDEAVFERDRHPRAAIREAWGKQGADAAYKRLTAKEIDNVFSLGIDGKLTAQPKKANVKIGAKSFLTQFAESESKKLHYRVWLTNEVPFGWAKFLISAKTGTGEEPLFEVEFVTASPMK